MPLRRFPFSRAACAGLCALASLTHLNLHAVEVTLDLQHVMTYLGYEINLMVVDPGDEDTTIYRWLKDGRVLTGQASSMLHISEARPQDAGTYQARVTLADGTTALSRKTPVVIAENLNGVPINTASRSLILQPRFWGPVDRVFWSQGPLYNRKILKDSWWVRGTQTARLRLLDRDMLSDNPDFYVVVGGEELLVASYGQAEEYLYNPHPIFHDAPWDKDLALGEDVGQTYIHADDGSLRVSGMPPGIVFTDLNSFYGMPTKAGNYRLNWRMFDPEGRLSDTSQSWIFVRDPAKPAVRLVPGLWAGPVFEFDADFDILSAGLIEVLTSPEGVFSGLLRVGLHRWPLAGSLRWDGSTFQCRMALNPPPGLKRLTCILEALADSSEYIGARFEIEPVNPEVGGAFWEADIRLPSRPDSAQMIRPPGLGNITAILRGDETEDGFALGHGFMSMSPAQNMQRMNVVGLLPDGSRIMGSMPVVSGQPYSIAFYNHPQQKGEALYGVLELIGLPWYLEDQPILQGFLDWKRVPAKGEKWLSGKVRQMPMDVTGEVYFLPDTGPLLPSTLHGTTSLVQLGGGSAFADFFSPEPTSFDLRPDHKAVFARPDPSSFKLDIYPPLGFFIGSCKLVGSSENNAMKPQTVMFRGMMVPGLSRGGGFFHFKAPPSSSADSSAIYSGSLDIFRPDDKER